MSVLFEIDQTFFNLGRQEVDDDPNHTRQGKIPDTDRNSSHRTGVSCDPRRELGLVLGGLVADVGWDVESKVCVGGGGAQSILHTRELRK